jgi:zinc protease
VQSEHTAAAAQEVLSEIDRIRREDVAAEELSLATSYLDGVFPIRYETTSAIAAALANLTLYGLPDDYFDAYRDRIRAVTTADVRRVAEAHLDPERLQLLVAGDPGSVRAPLEALGFGSFMVHEPDAEE